LTTADLQDSQPAPVARTTNTDRKPSAGHAPESSEPDRPIGEARGLLDLRCLDHISVSSALSPTQREAVS